MHFPKFALLVGGFGGPSGSPSVLVLRQGEVAVLELNAIFVLFDYLFNHWIILGAERTLIVGIFNQFDPGRFRPDNVVGWLCVGS